ncbi:hypothetical protein IFM89_012341 [Coptis chinensis]|uniref:F-box domain-containing protein n=1 Tax=Coptis chinensis TaxID=261450 RepID=A0A835I2P9_9MAGN|nr:hypothetical protein IFM89_012341 [Coptis chinensis]
MKITKVQHDDDDDVEEELLNLDDLLRELRENSGEFFSKLPSDIILDNIFSSLPLKSLSQCRWVCKTWYRFIHHPRFAQIHYQMAIQNRCSPCLGFFLDPCDDSELRLIDHQVFDNLKTSVVSSDVETYPLVEFGFSDLQIIGVVNGLVCFGEHHHRSYLPRKYIIYNPITGEHFQLPEDTCIFTDIDFAALGFDSAANEYKVIRIRDDHRGAEIFTLGTTRWRRVEDHVPKIYKTQPFSVLVNGNLHWISSKQDGPLSIFAFNVASEKFCEFESPPFQQEQGRLKGALRVIEELLCFIDMKEFDEFEMWVMKDYGVQGSWAKEYKFNAQVLNCTLHNYMCGQNVFKLKNGEFLVKYGPKDFGYYDAKQQTCQPVLLPITYDCKYGLHHDDCEYDLPHVFLLGSLFSPKNIGRLASSTQTQISDQEEEEEEKESLKDEEGEEIDLRVLQEMSGELFSKLPGDIIVNILCQIPVKSLSSQCRMVCKTWYDLIGHPHFAEFHYRWAMQNCCSPCVVLCDGMSGFWFIDHQVFDNLETSAPVHSLEFLKEPEFEKTLQVIGSVNGLLCFSEDQYKCSYPVFYYICNPITGEHIRLPRARELFHVEVSAFGFDSTTNEYKVIRFHYDQDEGEVYTLGSSRWRRINYGVPYETFRHPFGMLVSNHLHWISSGDGVPLTIVAFDMAAEEVHQIEPPPLVSTDIKSSLGVIEERLCFFRKLGDNYFEIWVMKDYGEQGYWAKEYFFDPEVTAYLSCSDTYTVSKLRNGEFLVCCGPTNLSYYDVKKETCRPIVVESHFIFFTIFQVGSLFSPKNVSRLSRK